MSKDQRGLPGLGKQSEPGTRIEGVLDRVVFQNEENHWTVARLSPDVGGDTVTIVGNLFGATVGTSLVLHGDWVEDARFGTQFRVKAHHTKSPETLLGIERYLGSGMIPGIGTELAKRIVECFGLATLRIIESEPGRLNEVEGIGSSRASSISKAWKEQRDIQDVMVFLRGHGVSTAFAVRIFKRYGQEAMELIRENPYRLALDIHGIGFRSADAIARQLGIGEDSPARIEAGLVHVLGELSEDGHVHAPVDPLFARAIELLSVPAEALEEAIASLRQANWIAEEDLPDRGRCISLLALLETERDAALAFAELVREEVPPLKAKLDKILKAFERDTKVELAPAQERAVRAASESKCLVITGGPGVGKTTIVRAIVALFEAAHFEMDLAAPTGRAAKRLTESTGREALTLHRLLEFQPQSGAFERNADRPLESDLVIVDEASMIDIALFRSLVVALPKKARLVLVGDVDQLPSVGPGSVLGDVIGSGAAEVVRLEEIFRQAAESQIIVSAHAVNRGEVPDLAPPSGDDPKRSDFYFVSRDEPASAAQAVLELVAERIPDRFGLNPFSEVQVITPMHRGALGTQALNLALQERMNPSSSYEIKRGERVFRIGDKVMQIRNDYERDVFNGDIGVIVNAHKDGLTLELADGRLVRYERNDIDQLTLAYVVSVHKSQGSEYPAVVLVLANQHYMMLQRNLLYTAMTRGKRLVVVVGSKRAFAMAVGNSSNRHRWTYLGERIASALLSSEPQPAD